MSRENALATRDRFLGHAIVNGTIPVTLFALLGQYDPKVVQVVVAFLKTHLSEHALALLPSLNFGLSVVVAGTELGIRYKLNTLNKVDELVHTPFPKIGAFTRREAAMFFVVAYGLQTVNGILAEHPDSDFTTALRKLYENPLFTFLGQMIIAVFADKLLFNVVPAVASKVGSGAGYAGHKLYDGAAYVGSSASNLWKAAKERCSKKDIKVMYDDLSTGFLNNKA